MIFRDCAKDGLHFVSLEPVRLGGGIVEVKQLLMKHHVATVRQTLVIMDRWLAAEHQV